MVDQLRSLRLRGDARRARGRHRRQARRPGRGARRRRHVEGPDRQRQLHGRQPDRPGPQHRRRDDGRRQRRPLARRSPSTCKGEILELKNTINTMVDQLSVLRRRGDARRARGRHRRQARRPGRRCTGVAGTWKDLTDSVNSMAGNLTDQVRNIAEVTTAVANGDLSKKITVDVKGEILELKDTINTMVDQLRSFASEVTRVAREVGTEGKLGGQAEVTRRRRHLEGPHRQRQLHGRQPHRPGAQHRRRDHGRRQRRPVEEDHRRRQGRDPRAEEHHQHDGRPALVLRLRGDARRPRGRHRGQARRPGRRARRRRHLEGPHRQRQLHGRQPHVQVRNIADVTTAVANGDLSKKITVDVKGEILELKNTINTMVDQLNVLRLRGDPRRPRGRHRRQARRPGRRCSGVAGTWKDLTDNVNFMAGEPDGPGARHRARS